MTNTGEAVKRLSHPRMPADHPVSGTAPLSPKGDVCSLNFTTTTRATPTQSPSDEVTPRRPGFDLQLIFPGNYGCRFGSFCCGGARGYGRIDLSGKPCLRRTARPSYRSGRGVGP